MASFRTSAALLAALLAMAAEPGQAQGAAVESTFVENCVHDEALEMRAGSDSALLDEDDRLGVQAAMVARFRQLGEGFAPTAIVLWRSPTYGWLYVALRPHATKPGKVCSFATFSAPVFEFTGELLRKYFFGSPT